MPLKVLNLLLYQLAWFACILGAARGKPWAGVAVAAVVIALHLAVSGNARRELLLVACAGVVGYVGDSLLAMGGLLLFPAASGAGGPSPLWMVALWATFATTLNSSLGWLKDRFGLALVLGLVGGPLAYAAGAGFGALEIGQPRAVALACVALEWGAAMPLLLWVNRLSGQRRRLAEVAA